MTAGFLGWSPKGIVVPIGFVSPTSKNYNLELAKQNQYLNLSGRTWDRNARDVPTVGCAGTRPGPRCGIHQRPFLSGANHPICYPNIPVDSAVERFSDARALYAHS